MARTSSPPQPHPANLTAAQMREAIPKIERRISDVEGFDPNSIRDRRDPRISALENRLTSLLDSIFGRETIEYDRYRYEATSIDRASINFAERTPHHEVIEGLTEGKNAVLLHVKEIIGSFREELDDRGVTPVGQAIRAYQGLDLHPEIQRAAGELYQNGHYANAIVDSVKALNVLVRRRSGAERDGTSLMEYVFNPGNPILKFNPLADQSDRDEQKGFMMMMSGAVAGLRNPRAHKFIEDDPERTLEFIAFISLLAKLLEKATK